MSDDVRRCPQCGATYHGGEVTCPYCGGALPPPRQPEVLVIEGRSAERVAPRATAFALLMARSPLALLPDADPLEGLPLASHEFRVARYPASVTNQRWVHRLADGSLFARDLKDLGEARVEAGDVVLAFANPASEARLQCRSHDDAVRLQGDLTSMAHLARRES